MPDGTCAPSETFSPDLRPSVPMIGDGINVRNGAHAPSRHRCCGIPPPARGGGTRWERRPRRDEPRLRSHRQVRIAARMPLPQVQAQCLVGCQAPSPDAGRGRSPVQKVWLAPAVGRTKAFGTGLQTPSRSEYVGHVLCPTDLARNCCLRRKSRVSPKPGPGPGPLVTLGLLCAWLATQDGRR